VTLGAQYNLVLAAHKSFIRFDYQFESRNPWQAAIQDPRSSQYSLFPTAISPTLPSTSFVQMRAGTTFGQWQASLFIDSGNPVYPPPGPQYNYYSFRPRTFGITATLHM
jgi:hypothetical protein